MWNFSCHEDDRAVRLSRLPGKVVGSLPLKLFKI